MNHYYLKFPNFLKYHLNLTYLMSLMFLKNLTNH